MPYAVPCRADAPTAVPCPVSRLSSGQQRAASRAAADGSAEPPSCPDRHDGPRAVPPSCCAKLAALAGIGSCGTRCACVCMWAGARQLSIGSAPASLARARDLHLCRSPSPHCRLYTGRPGRAGGQGPPAFAHWHQWAGGRRWGQLERARGRALPLRYHCGCARAVPSVGPCWPCPLAHSHELPLCAPRHSSMSSKDHIRVYLSAYNVMKVELKSPLRAPICFTEVCGSGLRLRLRCDRRLRLTRLNRGESARAECDMRSRSSSRTNPAPIQSAQQPAAATGQSR